MTEYAHVPEAEQNKVFAAAKRLLVERQRDVFDEEIVADTGLLISDVRAALNSLDQNGLTISPQPDGSVIIQNAEG